MGCGLELVDVHPMFGVKGRRGMHYWKVCTTGDKEKKEEEQP